MMIRQLSRDFAVKVSVKNYNILIQYHREQVVENNYPIQSAVCIIVFGEPVAWFSKSSEN